METKLNFNDSYIKRDVLLWVNNLMINKSENFESYEVLEAYVRNNMINNITRFIACNKKELNDIFNHYQEEE
tara:strand:+ start:1273 stop:1488 length:216 start_codon:yes stop_codon:yes gene_type:complete